MEEVIEIEDNLRKERIFVKSNKSKKIELKHLDLIKNIEESRELDDWTHKEMIKIKNITFKNNVFDIESKKIVSSIRLIKTSKIGRKITPMIWEYYKNRGNLDVNQVIKEYGRENLKINYSIGGQEKKIIIIETEIDEKNDLSS